MDDNSELKARLAELDQDLENEEITQKGYEKRRAKLLAQYRVSQNSPASPNSTRSGSMISSPHTSMTSAPPPAASPRMSGGGHPGSRHSGGVAPAIQYTTPHERGDTMVSAMSGGYDNASPYGQQQGYGGLQPGSGGGGPGMRNFSQPQAASQQWQQHARSTSYTSGSQPGSPPQHHSYAQPAQAPPVDQGRHFSAAGSYAPHPPQPGQMTAQQQYMGAGSAVNPYDPYYDPGVTPQPGGPGYGTQTMVSHDGQYEKTNTMTGYFADFPTQGYHHPSDAATQRDSYYSNAPQPPQPQKQQQQPPRQQHHPQQQQQHHAAYEPQRYTSTDYNPPYSPAAAQAPPLLDSSDMPGAYGAAHQPPMEPRNVPFDLFDPHNGNVPMSGFDNIASVLRHRQRTNPKQPAFLVLDGKGKEAATIAWDKLGSRAEKVAQVIREKSNLHKGDRVALIYREIEVIDFAVALMGCFIAGVVAVPINNPEDHDKLNFIIQQTTAHLALTTDNNLKAFQRDLTMHKLQWPRGVEWWKTNEFGSFHPKRKDEMPPLQAPDLAYIEYSRAPTGDLRGVVMDHRTIMHQMSCLASIVASSPNNDSSKDTFNPSLRDKSGRLVVGSGNGEVIVSYLDPRQSIGLIFQILFAVYGGHTTVYCAHQCVTTPGLYANIITRYRATLALADYPGLKTVAYNYQSDPFQTRNFAKKIPVDFSSIKLCLIDCLTVDAEFHDILADRWLKPLGNNRARDVVAPLLCLPEHGGMVIAMRDWLGGEERLGVPLIAETLSQPSDDKSKDKSGEYSGLIGGSMTRPDQQPGSGTKPTDLLEALIDKEALKTNDIVLVALGADAKKRAGEAGTVRLTAFGYPLPDATLAVVNPENSVLCPPNVVGEIWVDSPSLSGGFWGLPKPTESIFHARPYKFEPGNPLPIMLDLEFLRTGLLGVVVQGKIFVLGLYEDRLRQKVEWSEGGGMARVMAEYRYFFVQHLIVSIMKNVPKIYDSSAFDVFVNDEHLPIVLLESPAASTSPQAAGGPPRQLDTALLDSISEKCIEVLLEEHQVRVYCVMITAPNTLPRTWKNGRREIGNMLCRKEFDTGGLPCVHVKFGVERAVLNLPVGVDPVGGIWSPAATKSRQDILANQEKQYSGFDYREVVMDDLTSTSLNNFSNIVDLLQWRVTRQAEMLSYCTIDTKLKEGKGLSWKKLDLKIAAVAAMLRKKGIKAGDHVVLIYTHSEDFVYAVHACFCLGVIAIPMAPLDQNRLSEDVPALLHIISDFAIRAIIVNSDVDHLLKQKPLAQHIKQSASVLKITMPVIYNTSKPTKQVTGCRDLGFKMNPAWVQPGAPPAMVWTYWTPDQRRIAVGLGHDTLLGMCKVQKETCQMSSTKPLLGCVRSSIGIGFLHTCLMGAFLGAATYLVSPVDFATNPLSLFLTMSRYKVKDTYATPQMLDHAISMMPAKGFNLNEVKNMMISFDGRPRPEIFQKVRLHFSGAYLERTAISTIYSHVLNPMVASRSYMSIEPIELWLDTRALRRGLVYPIDPENDPSALLIQDSGMVPVSTQIAIVNPETNMLCHSGEYGEIWVNSEACAKSFYGSKDAFDAERFSGKTVDGDPRLTYVRTGDLGFLHTVSRPIGPGGTQAEMQVLFVLGGIGETFEVNGLSHFPIDIEYSVERCHRNIVPSGSAVFQAGGLVVVLVEVIRKSYLASIVPVIANAILNEHQLVVDIVAFVGQGDFPRSRLGEKQRGKILASWVTRKMRTIAQFGIRDSTSTQHVASHSRSTSMADHPVAPPPEEQHVGAPSLVGSHPTDDKGGVSNAPPYTSMTFEAVELPTDYHELPDQAEVDDNAEPEEEKPPAANYQEAAAREIFARGDTDSPAPMVPARQRPKTMTEEFAKELSAAHATPSTSSNSDDEAQGGDGHILTPRPEGGEHKTLGIVNTNSPPPQLPPAPVLQENMTTQGQSQQRHGKSPSDASDDFSIGSLPREALLQMNYGSAK